MKFAMAVGTQYFAFFDFPQRARNAPTVVDGLTDRTLFFLGNEVMKVQSWQSAFAAFAALQLRFIGFEPFAQYLNSKGLPCIDLLFMLQMPIVLCRAAPRFTVLCPVLYGHVCILGDRVTLETKSG
jgi:hypothetical protein